MSSSTPATISSFRDYATGNTVTTKQKMWISMATRAEKTKPSSNSSVHFKTDSNLSKASLRQSHHCNDHLVGIYKIQLELYADGTIDDTGKGTVVGEKLNTCETKWITQKGMVDSEDELKGSTFDDLKFLPGT